MKEENSQKSLSGKMKKKYDFLLIKLFYVIKTANRGITAVQVKTKNEKSWKWNTQWKYICEEERFAVKAE